MTHKSFPKPEPRPKRKPKRLPPVSEKRSEYQVELDEMRPLVIARAHGLCELCKAEAGEVIHHRLRRSHGGTNHLDNLVLLSDACHLHVHAEPTWAYENGWMIRSS